MIRYLYALRDKKLAVYSKVQESQLQPGDYVEDIRRSLVHPEVPLSFFDNDVYHLGTYDDVTGIITHFDKPEFLKSLDEFRFLREEKKHDSN